MWCKTCNKIIYDDICPTCGGIAQEDIPTEVYWCEDCNVPIIKEVSDIDKDVCPLCGATTKYMCADLRPVFPEERLLIEILLGSPLEWVNQSVWANNNRYYVNGKVKSISNSVFAHADIDKIVSQLEEFKGKNSYSYFNANDECHKIGAKETNKVIQDFSKSYEGNKKDFIGLTATPGRTTEDSLENRIFNEFFDRKIGIDIKLVDRISMGQNQARNRATIRDVIGYFQDRKILSKLIKEPLEYEVNNDLLEKLKKEFYSNREDYSPELITQIAANKSRNSVILNRLKELNTQGKPTIVFACSLDHAKMLSAFLNIENIPNSLVYGDMSAATRKKAIADFKDRDNPVNIIINYDILTTGFDSTNIDCVFITRPTKSVILYSQMIGRGLRGPQMGGAETCLLIDVKENLEVYNENEAFSHFNSYWR
mgnify:CR=1 FL=1